MEHEQWAVHERGRHQIAGKAADADACDVMPCDVVAIFPSSLALAGLCSPVVNT